MALDNLGVVLQGLRRYDEALAAHEQSLATYRALGDQLNASASLNHLGMTQRHREAFQAAEDYFHEALAIKDEQGPKAGKYNIRITGSQGIVIGDHAKVEQQFNTPPGKE